MTQTKISYLSVICGTLLGAGVCYTFNAASDKYNTELEQKLATQEERKIEWEKDPPYQTICKWYGKSGLPGILALGVAKDLDSLAKEMYIAKYEQMLEKYKQLSEEYKLTNPDYTPKTLLSSEAVFGKKQEKLLP